MTAFEAGHLDEVLGLCAAQGWPTLPADPDRALRVLQAPGTVTVVAVDDGDHVVGFAHALSDGLTGYLAQLLVAAQHRNRGTGHTLLDEVFNRSDIERLDVLSDTAEAFYATRRHRRYAGLRLYPGLILGRYSRGHTPPPTPLPTRADVPRRPAGLPFATGSISCGCGSPCDSRRPETSLCASPAW